METGLNKLKFILKRILVVGSLTIAGIFVILFLLYQFAKSNYYIENASIINAPLHKRIAESFRNKDGSIIEGTIERERVDNKKRTFENKRKFIITGHHIINGTGTVIDYHEHHDPSWNIDDETFEYITVFLPHGMKDDIKINDFNTDNVIVFYSRGSRAFLAGCVGYPRSGEVKIKKISLGRILVKLNLDMMSWDTGWDKWCDERKVVKSFIAHKHLFDD